MKLIYESQIFQYFKPFIELDNVLKNLDLTKNPSHKIRTNARVINYALNCVHLLGPFISFDDHKICINYKISKEKCYYFVLWENFEETITNIQKEIIYDFAENINFSENENMNWIQHEIYDDFEFIDDHIIQFFNTNEPVEIFVKIADTYDIFVHKLLYEGGFAPQLFTCKKIYSKYAKHFSRRDA